MKKLLITVLLLTSTSVIADDRDRIDTKRILDRASYSNCQIVIRNGKFETRNCSAERKKDDVIHQTEREIQRVLDRKVDKALRNIFG